MRRLLRGSRFEFRLVEVRSVDLAEKTVLTDHGPLYYDYLVLAAGSVTNYFANPRIALHSFGLDDLGAALQLRNHVLSRLEQALWASEPDERRRLLTFAVVGGGPTVVEFAAALAVLVREALGDQFGRLDLLELEAARRVRRGPPPGPPSRLRQHSGDRPSRAGNPWLQPAVPISANRL